MKRLCITAAVLLLVFLGSCTAQRETVRIDVAEALPLQSVIDGVLNNDPVTWRSAFLPEYDTAVMAQELELGTCTDYDAYISELISEAAEVRRENYGDSVTIELTDVTVRHITVDDRPELFADFKDIFTLRYRLDVSAIEDVAEVTCLLNISGSDNADSQTAVYITVKCGGKWYLHPVFYNLMY